MFTPFARWLPAIAAVLVQVSAFADTVTLRSGEKLEGKVVSETAAEVTIDVQISASITDQKSIPRAQIQKVEKATPDMIAFQTIKNYKPGPTSRPVNDYDLLITALQNFQKQFPNSVHGAEVQLDLDALEQEKARVTAGDFRVGTTWLSPEEAAKQRYQIEAEQLFNEMKTVAQADAIGALNLFEKIEKTFPGSRIYPDAIDLARRILAAFGPDVERRLQILKLETEKFVQTLAALQEPQKTQTMTAVRREQAQYDAALAQADKVALKWKPFIPRSEKSLTALKALIPTESTRLAALPVAQMRSSIEQAEKARAALGAKDPATADTLLKAAAAAWPANQSLVALQADLTALQAEIAKTPPPAAETPAKVTKRPANADGTPATGPGETATTGSGEPGEATSAAAAPKKDALGSVKDFLFSAKGAMAFVALAVILIGLSALSERRKRAAMPTRED